MLAALLVAGCAGETKPDATPSKTVDSSASPSTSEATETPTTEAPSPTETAASFTFPTTLGPEVMLQSAPDAQAVSDEQEWAFGDCGATLPPEATDSRAMFVGDGAWEIPVGVQQVVAFADEAAAVAELDRLAESWAACAAQEPYAGMVYHVEPFPVGENGVQLVVDYSDAMSEYGDDAVGYVAALFHRGNTVTLVGALGGESTIGSSRQTAAAMGSAAWDLLCAHEENGCSAG